MECVERRYFADIFYLALVCEDEVLASRLRKFSTLNENSSTYDKSESKRKTITQSFAWVLMPQTSAMPGPLSGGVPKRSREF